MHLSTSRAGWSRNKYHSLHKGQVKIVDNNSHYSYKVEQGVINEEFVKKGGTKIHLKYDEFRKEWKDGKLLSHYKYWRNTSRHGKGYEKNLELKGNKGIVYHVYYRGSLMKEKFIYQNGVTAYDISRRSTTKTFEVKNPAGKVVHSLISETAPIFTWAYKYNIVILNHATLMLSATRNYKILTTNDDGTPTYKGEVKNGQKIGRWIEGGKDRWYLQGVSVGQKIFETPEDKLNIMDILNIDNTQLRSAFLSKYSTQGMFEKLRAEGIAVTEKVEGDMKLYTIPIMSETPADNITSRDRLMKFLEVTCPSTHAKYMLKVPPQTQTCEEGRQWTFGAEFRRINENEMRIPSEEFVEFAEET